MGAILAIILPLLSQLPGAIGDYFKGQQKIEQLKQENNLAIQQANIQLAQEMARAKLEWQKEALKSTGSYFKYFTFIMWFGPYMAQLIYPPLGKQIFENMSGMPEWYAQSCVLIMFTIWGISVSAPVISNIFAGMKTFFAERRDYKVKITEAKYNRKAVFDVIRQIFPKGMNQAQVDLIDRALDAGEQQE